MNRRPASRATVTAAAGLAAGVRPGSGIGVPASAGSGGHAASRQPVPELLIRGGTVVNADATVKADVRIVGERIVEIGPDLRPGVAARVVDATGHLVMPGGIDPHVHLQGSFVDDLTTGTAAAVAGGITTVGTFAYPEGDENPLEAMDRSLGEVARLAIGDVFFHASSWPPTREFAAMMPGLAERGQPSHKVFMTRADFGARRGELIEVLEAAREAGVVTLMHCEDGVILAAALERLRAGGRTSLAHYAESRPELAEIAATNEAVALCSFTGAPMHLVHQSQEEAVGGCPTPGGRVRGVFSGDAGLVSWIAAIRRRSASSSSRPTEGWPEPMPRTSFEWPRRGSTSWRRLARTSSSTPSGRRPSPTSAIGTITSSRPILG